jgi:tripartite-type tricarboxylate transporter receptor subunit TctC
MLAKNSTTNQVTEPVQPTGSGAINLLLFNGVFGIHFRAIPGYASTNALLAGLIRGDGCVTNTSLSSLASDITGGIVIPILANIRVPKTNLLYSYLANVPTYAEAVQKYKKFIKTGTGKAAVPAFIEAGAVTRILFVPPKTPQIEQAALRAAFEWASKNPNLQAKESALALPTGYVSGKDAKTEYTTYLSSAKRARNFLGILG